MAGVVAIVAVAAAVGSGVGIAVDHGAGPSPAGANAATGGSSTSVTGVSARQLNVSAIAASVDPAVVDIYSTLGYQNGQAAGTGMVLTPGGQVLTNNHVVEGATSIKVRIGSSQRRYTAKVLGTDPTADVALLQVQGVSGLATVNLGDSSKATLGEQVVAIGNALDLQGPPTVTSGIISALGRSITAGDSTGTTEHLTGLIQTDAPLAPGNSGGPLVDAAGQVIGMDTAAATGTLGQSSSNIGFAIPIDTARAIASQIQAGRASATVQIGQRGFLGVEVGNASAAGGGPGPFGGGGFSGGGFGGFGGPSIAPVSSGALVLAVVPGSPAQSAGLAAGDVIVSLDGQSVPSAARLTQLLGPRHPGAQVSLGWVDQSGQHQQATVKLAKGPAA